LNTFLREVFTKINHEKKENNGRCITKEGIEIREHSDNMFIKTTI